MQVQSVAKRKAFQLLVTRAELAAMFGCSQRQISALEAERVLQPAVRGRGGRASRFAVKSCLQAYLRRERAFAGGRDGESPQQARAWLDKRRAEEIELRLTARRKALMPADEITRSFNECAAAVRARLHRVPEDVAERVVAARADGPHAIKRILLAEIDSALRELAAKANAPDDPAA